MVLFKKIGMFEILINMWIDYPEEWTQTQKFACGIEGLWTLREDH